MYYLIGGILIFISLSVGVYLTLHAGKRLDK